MELTEENFYTLLQLDKPYAHLHQGGPNEFQIKAKRLCWQYNQTSPDELDKRMEILRQMLGTCPDMIAIQPQFNCDYGINIHCHGFAYVNYNCTFLDTSPIHLGNMVLIAPGCVLSCAGHAIHPQQRAEGIGTSAPIHIQDNVWIGANCTICGGVTIGQGSVIGAGSVVVKDIPTGVVAAGVPCKVIRPITEADKIPVEQIIR